MWNFCYIYFLVMQYDYNVYTSWICLIVKHDEKTNEYTFNRDINYLFVRPTAYYTTIKPN